MTEKQLRIEIRKRTRCSLVQISRVMESIKEIVKENLIDLEPTFINGLCKFYIARVNKSKKHNPRTKEIYVVPEHITSKVKISESLKQKVKEKI